MLQSLPSMVDYDTVITDAVFARGLSCESSYTDVTYKGGIWEVFEEWQYYFQQKFEVF